MKCVLITKLCNLHGLVFLFIDAEFIFLCMDFFFVFLGSVAMGKVGLPDIPN